MTPEHKKILRALVLELRSVLEGADGRPGDLERRLVELGVRRDREPIKRDELPRHADHQARATFDAYLDLRLVAARDAKIAEEARRALTRRGRAKSTETPELTPAERTAIVRDCVDEFIRESAYTWANRLLALRCMEARGLIDEVVLQKESYGGKSLAHWRLAQRDPDVCRGEDEGIFATLFAAFDLHAEHLPRLFHQGAPGLALRPTLAALRRCLALLSGSQKPRSADAADDAVFSAPDALGWAYQFWNTETKARVLAATRIKDKKQKKKIEGSDIIPATQLYTEPYMVRFLVQNSLGATWAAMHPDTRLAERWDYFVRDADRTPMLARSATTLTVLDPACGSGHFLLAAQADLWDMYEEEGAFTDDPVGRARAILERNLFGIDIDERAVQIAEAALWMAAAEKLVELEIALDEPDADGRLPLSGVEMNLVATNFRLPGDGEQLDAFLKAHPDEEPLRKALAEVFRGLAHVDELGSLAKIEGPVEDLLRNLKATGGVQPDLPEETVPGSETSETFEAWKDRIVHSLESHFASDAVDTDLARRFFGQAAGKAVQVFELLSRRYDIVVANPPYMGSKNMGEVLRTYVETHYAPGKRDLYAAFLLRCRTLCVAGGRFALVVPEPWMFFSSYEQMRYLTAEKLAEKKSGTDLFPGLLKVSSIETLAQLGRHAFEEADPPSNVALLVFSRREPTDEHKLTAFRLHTPRPSTEQAALLRAIVNNRSSVFRFTPRQGDLRRIPMAPVAFWLPASLLQLFAGPALGEVGRVAQGTATAEDPRFVRFIWETPRATWSRARLQDGRWVPFEKGGGYGKWFGHQWWMVDWQHDGARINGTSGPRVQGTCFFFKQGWTYSLMARGSMGLRIQDPPATFGHMGPKVIVPHDGMAAVCNSRAFSYLVRTSSPSLKFEVDSVGRGPVPADSPAVDTEALLQLKRGLVARDLTERAFNPHTAPAPTLRAWARETLLQIFAESAVLHTLEGESERAAFVAYGIGEADTATITAEVGTPAGWFGLVAEHANTDALPWPPGSTVPTPPTARVQAPPPAALRAALAAGPSSVGAGEDDDTDDDADDDADEGLTGKPIPTETFLEALAQRFGVHPISLYHLLRAGIERAGWRCPPEEQRLVRDRLTVMILQLLGHQWPTQIAGGEPSPEWADTDGIVPITEGTHEDPLLARMRARLVAEFPGSTLPEIERDIAELTGQSLEAWINGGFFRHHCKKEQFRRRPVAWQLQCATSDLGIVFACFVHFHALNTDTLPKLRNHYIGPLRTRAETELRGIEALPKPQQTDTEKDRSAALEKRMATLENLSTALRTLDDELSRVIARGFFTPELAEHAIDDAAESHLAQLLDALVHRLAATLPAEALEPHAAAYLRAVDEAATRARQALPDDLPFAGDALTTLPRVVGFEEFRADLRRDLEALARGLPGAFDELLKLERTCAKSIESDAAELAKTDPVATRHAELLDSTRTRPTFPAEQADKLASGDSDALTAAERVLNTHKAALQAVVYTYLHSHLKTSIAHRCGAAFTNIPRRYFTVKKHRAVDVHETELRNVARVWVAAAWDHVLALASGFALHDEFTALGPGRPAPRDLPAFMRQEQAYTPDLNDGVRVNIAPLQKAGLLAAEVLPPKDPDEALKDRARWRSDERRWCRSGRLPRPGWWPEG